MKEDSDDDALFSIGLMFDASAPKRMLTVHIGEGLEIALKSIGDDPGHKQSGQYLWPASVGLAKYLSQNPDLIRDVTTVLELGAGCGLCGITVTKLSPHINVYFTDYDNGTLDLIKESVSLNSIPLSRVFMQNLRWGDSGVSDIPKVSLVIGSDLIYCGDVVMPLFKTVSHYLEKLPESLFILATSFELEKVCKVKNFHHSYFTSLNVHRKPKKKSTAPVKC